MFILQRVIAKLPCFRNYATDQPMTRRAYLVFRIVGTVYLFSWAVVGTLLWRSSLPLLVRILLFVPLLVAIPTPGPLLQPYGTYCARWRSMRNHSDEHLTTLK